MTKSRKPDISVVIPVYNNETTIEKLSKDLLKKLKGTGHSCEIILVNDASIDNSWQVINKLSGQFDEINAINMSRNQGQNMAIFTGLKETKADIVLTMDADLQDDPGMVSELIQVLDQDTDIVFIKRLGQYQAGGRMFSSLLFKGFLQFIIGLHRKAGSYYVMKQNIVRKIVSFNCRYPIMTVMAYSLSHQVKYLPAHRGSNEGNSSYTFWRRCRYAFRATYCALQCRIHRLKS